MADTNPPDSPPVTQQITPSPKGPGANQTIDESQTQISPQVKSLQRLEYELNADLYRGVILLPLDVRVAAQQVVALQGYGTLVASNGIPGNYLVEEHVLTLESSSDATSELIIRGCQNVDALYNVPGATGSPATAQSNNVQSPGGSQAGGSSIPGASPSQNQGPEL
jgi:hypothetical protein